MCRTFETEYEGCGCTRGGWPIEPCQSAEIRGEFCESDSVLAERSRNPSVCHECTRSYYNLAQQRAPIQHNRHRNNSDSNLARQHDQRHHDDKEGGVSVSDGETGDEIRHEQSYTDDLDEPDDRQRSREEELHAAHTRAERQMLEQALSLSLDDADREYNARAHADLERALRQSLENFDQDAEHQARIASYNSYIEDLARAHARDKRSMHGEPQDYDVRNESPPSPKPAIRGRWAQTALPQVAQTAGQIGTSQQPSRKPETFTATATAGPPSPPLTIRRANAQSPVEERRRQILYSTHPNRPPAPSSTEAWAAHGLQPASARATKRHEHQAERDDSAEDMGSGLYD